jgi:putative ABC transport system ATP-binding protein
MCAMMGPSGSGKSTLLHITAGLTTLDGGEVEVAGKTISSRTQDDLTLLRRREIGVVFQFFNLIPYMSTYENVALPLRFDRTPPTTEREAVERALERVKMTHRRNHHPSQLSGGELQRTAIARALVIEPSVLLADEPTGNLDTTSARAIMELLREINTETGVTTLIVTHDPVWAAICDRVVRLVDGALSEDQTFDEGEAIA